MRGKACDLFRAFSASKSDLTLTWGVTPGYYICAPLALGGLRFDPALKALGHFLSVRFADEDKIRLR
jgi:hypothetical protein